MRVKMSKPPPPAPTASATGPCPTVIKIVGRPGTGSLHYRTTRPPRPSIAEVVESLFLFIALAAILFNVAESFEQFLLRVTQEAFLYHYFKTHRLVQEDKSFVGFSIFSSGGHLVHRSGTV